jgi:hypothetical protein
MKSYFRWHVCHRNYNIPGGERMVLSKNLDDFINYYGFIDSIVTGVKWHFNLLDLLIEVDFYESKGKSKELVIRFKNCREALFTMTKCFDAVPKSELKDYIWSWHTITNCIAKDENGLLTIGIKTIDDDPRWLTVKCEEVWVESKD